MASGRPAAAALAVPVAEINFNAVNTDAAPSSPGPSSSARADHRDDMWIMSVGPHNAGHQHHRRLLLDSGSPVIVCPRHVGDGTDFEYP